MSTNQKNQELKVAVVSGGTGYVGSEIVKRLAADGMRVAALYLNASEEVVTDIISKLPGSGHQAYQCDLRDADAVNQTIETIEKNQGAIYVCVHAAGTMPKRKKLYLSSVGDVKEQFDADVFSAFNFLSSCAVRIKEYEKGIIIGITTAAVVSQANTKARGVYSPVKFALQGILSAFREELSPYGVRVYSVAPGVMPGGLNKETPQAFLDMVKEKSPTKNLAQASDVAGTVSFLCSRDSFHLANLTLLVAPEAGTT